MKPAPFRYHAPASCAEALDLLAGDGDVRALAGGQSLVPMMAMRVAAVDALVDLNGVDDLSGIEDRDGVLRIGAMTRQSTLQRSAAVAARCPLIGDALRHVGHRATRNRGTVGGSLAHLDPAAELPAAMLALDATLEVRRAGGARTVRMADFPVDLLTPDLAAGELIASVTVPGWPGGHGHAFVEFSRRPGDFAIVAVAALLERGRDDTVRRASLVVAGAGPVPLRRAAAEALLTGSRGDGAFDDAACEAAALDAMEDLQGSPDYRRHLARTLTRRALALAWQRARAA